MLEKEPGPYSRHIPALDGLRGVAVLGVVASHIFPGKTVGNGYLLLLIGKTLSFGAMGVDLFFVLSGLLITGILYDSLSDSGFFRKFYARRTLRIFPLYYGVLFVLLVFAPWIGISWRGTQWVYLLYLQNTTLVLSQTHLILSRNISLDHLWSLAVEEQFYLVWPCIVFFVRDLKKLLVISLGFSFAALLLRLGLAFHHTPYDIINRSTLCRADALLLGSALALTLRSGRHDWILNSARTLFFWCASLYAALSLVGLAVDRHPSWQFSFDATFLSLRYTLMALVSAALIAWCLRPRSAPRHLFENRVLRYFGKYSYGIYVLHLLAMPFFLRTFRLWISHLTPSKLIGVVGAGLLVFFISVVAAYLSYNLFEKQFLRMKRHFGYDRAKSVRNNDAKTLIPTA